MKKLRVGIVGCGRISIVYKDVFKDQLDRIQLVLAMDKELARAEAFAKSFEACGSTDDFDRVLSSGLDLVHICTPHFLHKDQVLACLDAGIHVLTEKPMAINLDDARKMIETSHKSQGKFGVIFQNRYIPGIQEAKKILDSGDLGQVIGARSSLTWWRPPSYYDCDWKGSWEKEGGGVLIDQAIHSIDLVQYLVNSKVERIDGQIANRVLKNVEVEDVASAAIKFKNGCIYSLFATNYYTHNAPIQIELMTEKATIKIVGFDVVLEKDGTTRLLGDSHKKSNSGEGYWGIHHSVQISEFYDCVIEDKPVVVNGEEGIKPLQIVLGVYQSAKEGRPIYLDHNVV